MSGGLLCRAMEGYGVGFEADVRHACWHRLWVLEESQIEGCKHQDNANVHHKTFPESILEEQHIDANDNGD
ncbi:MAG: hypothetical protein M0Z84_08230 [Gammaproteobacteria bacterium]|nr:hypothetical protein [Gammaproteobacteria bacterium]